MAMYNETGVITWKSEVTTGTSQRGEWKRMEIVLKRDNAAESYTDIVLRVFGADKVDLIQSLKEGEKVDVVFSVNMVISQKGSRFNDVSVYKIERHAAQQPAPSPAPQTKNIPASELDPKDDDFPF